MSPIKEYSLKLLEVIRATPEVKLFRFEYPQDSEFTFYPGQFMMVFFIDEPEIKYGRAYSISSSPENKDYLEIGLDKVAKFTEKMFQLRVGGTMKLKGPYGKFYFNDEVKNDIVLIGGGTGITPLMGIVRYCTDKKLKNKIMLIYSVRMPELIIYKEEFEKIKRQNENFDYIITITRPEESAESNNWGGRVGRINIKFLKENIISNKENLFYLCGSNGFVKDIIAMLGQLGVSKEQIKTDVWGNYEVI